MRLWDEAAELKRDQRAVSLVLARKGLKPAATQALIKRFDTMRYKLIDTFISILPYERARVAPIETKDDEDVRIIDLKRLPDARLQQLKEITLLLAGAGTSTATS
jgi:hypothetical protein